MKEYLDFLANGYVVRVKSESSVMFFASLIHRWNGNRITIRYRDEKARIEKNGKVVKKWPSNF